jgi:hypothetical protein
MDDVHMNNTAQAHPATDTIARDLARTAYTRVCTDLDRRLFQLALVSFAGKLKSKRVLRVECERIRWKQGCAHVELMDGAVLVVDVRQRDKQAAETVELSHLHRLGAVVSTGALADAWLAAHEGELVQSWSEHCAAER